jgi:hypothetical protein
MGATEQSFPINIQLLYMKPRLSLLGPVSSLAIVLLGSLRAEAQLTDSIKNPLEINLSIYDKAIAGESSVLNANLMTLPSGKNDFEMNQSLSAFQYLAPPDPGDPGDPGNPMVAPPNPQLPDDSPEEGEGRLSFYPNPATERLNISFAHNASVIVYDFSGHQKFAGSFSPGHHVIDLNSFPQGSYVVHVQAKGKFYRQQLVKN